MTPLDRIKRTGLYAEMQRLECYEAILAEVKRYNSKIYDQAISNVKASGKYDDNMFEDLEG